MNYGLLAEFPLYCQHRSVIISPASYAGLLWIAGLGVAGLVLLVTVCRLNAFLAIMVASLFVGIASGMDFATIGKALEVGMGNVLGPIAMVIGLGTVLGRLLAESGGAQALADAILKSAGENRLTWALASLSFLVGLPVFFGVGVMLMVPIIFALAAARTTLPWLVLVLPTVAGLTVAHGLVPPHPGPMAAIGLLSADVGKTIGWSIVLSIPLLILAGPLFTRFVQPRLNVLTPALPAAQSTQSSISKQPASLPLTLLVILLPVSLMMIGSLALIILAPDNPWRKAFTLLGHPIVAMLTGVLVSMIALSRRCGFTRQQLLKFSEDCLGPVASILLVVGAGGGFSRVLVESGVGDAIQKMASDLRLPPLIFGWVIAALIRVAVGSATVAITAAAGLLAPIVAADPSINRELLILSLGCGSLILSHVNDGGFWFVKECFKLSVGETLRTWTVMETIIAVAGLGLVLLLDALIS